MANIRCDTDCKCVALQIQETLFVLLTFAIDSAYCFRNEARLDSPVERRILDSVRNLSSLLPLEVLNEYACTVRAGRVRICRA